MPIECMFFPNDTDEVRFYKKIRADQKSAIIDFVGRVFIVKCFGHDCGGIVVDADSTEVIQLEPGQVELLEDLPHGELIPPEGRYCVPATNAADGREGLFVVEHDLPFTTKLN